MPGDKVEFIYSDELYKDIDYWAKTVIIAKNLTIARTTRTLEIAGRKEAEAHYVSDYLYTPMQVADIFQHESKNLPVRHGPTKSQHGCKGNRRKNRLLETRLHSPSFAAGFREA